MIRRLNLLFCRLEFRLQYVKWHQITKIEFSQFVELICNTHILMKFGMMDNTACPFWCTCGTRQNQFAGPSPTQLTTAIFNALSTWLRKKSALFFKVGDGRLPGGGQVKYWGRHPSPVMLEEAFIHYWLPACKKNLSFHNTNVWARWRKNVVTTAVEASQNFTTRRKLFCVRSADWFQDTSRSNNVSMERDQFSLLNSIVNVNERANVLLSPIVLYGIALIEKQGRIAETPGHQALISAWVESKRTKTFWKASYRCIMSMMGS